jgi:hypothetical protein
MSKDVLVPVLDQYNRFISSTNPAKARILIKKGKALVFNKNPFMIKLLEGERCFDMAKITQRKNTYNNFTNYFKSEREVFIQNVGGTQISLSFMNGGQKEFITLPNTRKPYNLTSHLPFESIKYSTDFRKLLMRRPQILVLLEEEDFINYYEGAAASNGTTIEEEIDSAEQLLYNLTAKVRDPVTPVKHEQPYKENFENLEKRVEINSRVTGLCALAMPEMEDERVSEFDFVEELKSLGPDLSIHDWSFVQSNGIYDKVKNLAAQAILELTADN